MIKICEKITKYSVYALVFLLPVLFLPFTSDVLDFNKQALLVLLAFVSLFSWMLKVLASGKFEFNAHKIHIFAGIILLAWILSTVFSVDRYGSFWGWPRITADSLLSVIGFSIFYFIASSVLLKKEITNAIYIFFASALVVEIFGAIQLFGKNIAFNTIGSAGGLGAFAAVLLPLAIILLILSKKWAKLFFAAEIILSGLLFVLINYPAIWLITAIGSALLIIIGFFKRNLFDGRWMALPIFFLAVSLFFIILNPQINFLPQKPNEISLSKEANFQIDIEALKENPVFGSGPGTFSYNFSKFKNSEFSKTVLWNMVFSSGNSKILTAVPTVGVIGILAIFSLIISTLFFAGKFLILQKGDFGADNFYSVLGMGLFISFIVLIVSFFLRNSNISLDFLFFFIIAALAGLILSRQKSYELKPSSLIALAVTFVFTLVFIFGLGLLILDGQRYIAEIVFYKGLQNLQAGKLDDSIKNFETAVTMNSSADLYFRQLSQVYLLKIQSALSDKNASEENKSNTVRPLVANSVNVAKLATDVSPKNADNWLVRGYIYQSLGGFVSDSLNWAINSYNEAIKLDPNNPYVLIQLGSIYYQTKDYQSAKTNLDRALELKPDYSNGLYFSGLTYDQLGDKDKAIERFARLAELNPDSRNDIQKIIDNLKAGNSALSGLGQQPPASEAPEILPQAKQPEKPK